MSAEARALLTCVRDELDNRWPLRDRGGTKPPEGLRLEMHPAVYYALLRDADLMRYYSGGTDDMDEHLAGLFRIPVKITQDLERGHWRLVIVTEDVLKGGILT